MRSRTKTFRDDATNERHASDRNETFDYFEAEYTKRDNALCCTKLKPDKQRCADVRLCLNAKECPGGKTAFFP